MTVAETIRQERKKAGLSQAELGKRLGVSQSMIAQYECGIRKPKMSTIQLISDALGADIELFLQAIIDEAAKVVEKAEEAAMNMAVCEDEKYDFLARIAENYDVDQDFLLGYSKDPQGTKKARLFLANFEKAEASGDFSELEKEMGLPPGSIKPLPPEEKERIEKEEEEKQRKINRQIHRISFNLRSLNQRGLNRVEDCVTLLLKDNKYREYPRYSPSEEK